MSLDQFEANGFAEQVKSSCSALSSDECRKVFERSLKHFLKMTPTSLDEAIVYLCETEGLLTNGEKEFLEEIPRHPNKVFKFVETVKNKDLALQGFLTYLGKNPMANQQILRGLKDVRDSLSL